MLYRQRRSVAACWPPALFDHPKPMQTVPSALAATRPSCQRYRH